jgi:FSR family fosmidomycin resistance protein-like MFS transporter
VGLALDFAWKSSGHWGTTLVCAVVFGKTIGGFIADKFGVFKSALFSLGIAAFLFLLPQVPIAGVTAILLFNMTMPITLWAMAKITPGAKGFAFGLLAFGLFLGFLPVYLGVDVSQYISWIFALISAISLVILSTGLRRAKL